MAETLGILVNSEKNLQYVINLTQAAYAKGKDVQIFCTGKGVLVTQQAGWEKLVGKARLSVCDVSFRSNNLEGDVAGVGFKDFATQARNAEMVAECDRFVVL